MARVFAYKGFIGIDGTNPNHPVSEGQTEYERKNLTDALINNPLESGQLGFVCHLTKCEITQEAIDLMKQIKPGNDGLGDLDMFGSDDGPILSWLGGPYAMFKASEVETSRDYDTSLLDGLTPSEIELPELFVGAIDDPG